MPLFTPLFTQPAPCRLAAAIMSIMHSYKSSVASACHLPARRASLSSTPRAVPGARHAQGTWAGLAYSADDARLFALVSLARLLDTTLLLGFCTLGLLTELMENGLRERLWHPPVLLDLHGTLLHELLAVDALGQQRKQRREPLATRAHCLREPVAHAHLVPRAP